MTDAEVKKALECCANLEACEKCPMASLQKYDSDTCERQIMLYALDLINRQEGENEKNENIIRVADKTIATLNAENESLKAEFKAEAYKECIEKVKEKSYEINMCHNDIVVRTDYQIPGESLDNLLKEMVGEDNSTNIDKQN